MKKRINILLAVMLVINTIIPINFAQALPDGVFVDYDFTKMTEVPANTTTGSAANTSISSASIGEDNGVKVLQWKRTIKAYIELANMNIPLETPITKADFPIEIEYSAKLDKLRSAPRGPFALKGTNAAGAVVNTLYGPTKQGSYVTDELRTMSTKDNNTHYILGNNTDTDILYNGIPLDSSKYYIHNFIIEADGTYTYKIKEDTQSGIWQDIYPDKKHWVSASDWDPENVWRNRGILPDTITSLWSEATYYNAGTAPVSAEQAAIDGAKEQVDCFKYLKISKHTLKFKETNLPEGDNPKFGEKNIKLYFNAPISADTIYNGIKLYKDNAEVSTDKYTLSVDTTNTSSLVKLVLGETPAVGSNYEIRINDQLNKGKTGYRESVEGYSKIIAFHNEPGTTLSLVSSTPVNGASYPQKKITLDFSSLIDLQSAKANIKVYKGEEQLGCDTDYTVELDVNDESIVYVTLNSEPENSQGEVKLWYKVVIGEDLNKNTSASEVFPDTYTEKTISFYSPDYYINYDFTAMTELPEYTAGMIEVGTGSTEVSLAEDGNTQVLKWKRNINTNAKSAKMELPLETPITVADFPIEVEYSAKLDGLTNAPRGHFGLKGTTSGNEVKSLYGPTTHKSYADYAFRIISDKAGENFIGYADEAKTKILYNGSPLASDKYYIHNFVINADGTYTYRIKEDTENAEWQNIHSDYTLWVLSKDYPLDIANAGVLPTTITSLYSEAGYFSGENSALNATQTEEMLLDKIDYFKYLKISKHTLKLIETNLGEGENTKFGEKNINLFFNAPISDDTLYNGIKLYKDGTEVLTDEYTLSVDSANKSMVHLVLNDYPTFGSSYEIRINDQLNKNKEGYVESTGGYSDIVRFYNEQGTGLDLISSTPEDGDLYAQRKITLDFNAAINLDSAKESIKVYKGEQVLVCDTDYTVELDNGDETIVYITLNKVPEKSDADETLWYSVVIGAELNDGYNMSDVFPDTYTEKTIKFYNSSVLLDYNFTAMTALPEYTAGMIEAGTGSTEVNLADDGDTQVLQWKRNINTNAKSAKLELPLETPITAEDFPIQIEYSAKLDGLTNTPRGHFGLKGTDVAGVEVKSLYGPTTYKSYADYAFRIISDKAGENFIGYADEAKTKILYNEAALDSNKYYIHRFVINADGTYTYMIKEDKTDAEWQNIHSDYTLWVLSKDYPLDVANAGILPTTITSLYSEAGYYSGSNSALNATQTEEMLLDKIDYFKYLRITKNVKPVINKLVTNDGTEFNNGGTEIPDDIDSVKIYFKTPLVSAEETVTKDNISLYSVTHGDETKIDESKYELSYNNNDNYIEMTFADGFELGTNKEYRLKLKALATLNIEGAAAYEEIISFETAKDYEILNPVMNTDGATITVSANVKAYHKQTGNGYLVMAALMKNDNVFCDVQYTSLTVQAPNSQDLFSVTPCGLLSFDEFTKPEDFNASDYSVKLFVFDALEDSIYKCTGKTN